MRGKVDSERRADTDFLVRNGGNGLRWVVGPGKQDVEVAFIQIIALHEE